MGHEHSYLYKLVNGLLVRLLGEPSPRWLKAMGLADSNAWLPDHVIMAFFVVGVVWWLLATVRRRLSLENPSALQQFLELVVSGLRHLVEDVVGHGASRTYLPFIAALAVFIFVSNIFGLFFFLQPPTSNLNVTFALSLTAFLFYNLAGVRKNGLLGHLKHFLGPVWWLAPLMLPLEIISHLARILSLSLRLFGNIFGEHTATAIFASIVPFLLPWPMMGLGILGATIQTFVFIMLTAVYIAGVVAEEH